MPQVIVCGPVDVTGRPSFRLKVIQLVLFDAHERLHASNISMLQLQVEWLLIFLNPYRGIHVILMDIVILQVPLGRYLCPCSGTRQHNKKDSTVFWTKLEEQWNEFS